MKYQVTMHAMKEVDDWDEENGATGKGRLVDQWSKTMTLDHKPTRRDFADFVYDRYSLPANQFRYWEEEPGRFTMNRVENNDGEADERGHYLADYDVIIKCVPLQKEVSVGNFGLESVDGP